MQRIISHRLARRLGGLVGALLFSLSTPAAAQDEQTTEPFMLGTIVVVGKRLHTGGIGNDQVASYLSAEDLRRYDRNTVGDALDLLAGVTVSTNSRNEKMISVRGFDSRQVPLFIDGIPVYVPYDGYVDFDRFDTFDLAAIQVAKGFSSVAYGANALGGAINLVSRKPLKQFEGDVSARVAGNGTRRVSTNIGTNQQWWYLQAGVVHAESDGFRLSSDFKPTPVENGGERDNAWNKDRKLSLKLGLTPNDTDEYALSYHEQRGEKGQPPSTDPALARYWQWPQWDKKSLYFVSRTALTATEQLKLRLYLDRFDNEVNSYTDKTYTQLKTSGRGSVGTGRSIYDDDTHGASVELESTRLSGHVLRLVAHDKRDEHKEYDATGLTNTHYKDGLRSLAVEDTVQFGTRWSLSLGLARHEMRPRSVFSLGNPYTLPGNQRARDAQAGLFFDWSDDARLHATVARKSRLPTLKDRYSQRLGTYIENPDLQPEESLNYEIGYQGRPWRGVTAEAAVFLSNVSDKIQSVANVSGILSQMRNVGKVRMRGAELGLSSELGGWLSVGANYTRILLDNRSDPAIKLTDAPTNKLIAHAVVRPSTHWELVALVEHNGERWASNTARLESFTTLDLKASFLPVSGLAFAVGVDNLNDKNYQLDDGFPAPGRMWFVNASYRF